MKTVWILKSPTPPLGTDQTEALRLAMKHAGGFGRVVGTIGELEGRISEGDVVLVLGFNPDLMKLAAARDAGAKFKLAVYLNTHPAADAVHWASEGVDVQEWQYRAEVAMLGAVNVALAPTKHMVDMLVGCYGAHEGIAVDDFLVVGGFLNSRELKDVRPIPWPQRKARVVWPYRGTPEDNLVEFERIAKKFGDAFPDMDVEWVAVRDRLETRAQLLQEFNLARVVVCTRMAEVFPHELAEAAYMGANLLAPARLCYPELLPPANLYEEGKAVEQLRQLIETPAGAFGKLADAPNTLRQFVESA